MSERMTDDRLAEIRNAARGSLAFCMIRSADAVPELLAELDHSRAREVELEQENGRLREALEEALHALENVKTDEPEWQAGSVTLLRDALDKARKP